MKVRITRLRDDVPMPKYETLGSVGFDFVIVEDDVIEPGEFKVIPTGLVVCVPDGYMLMIASRSSLPKRKGLMLPNSVGIIDKDYCGPEDELKLQLYNFTEKPVEIKKGERLCQGVFVRVDRFEWEEGSADGPSRGGFGSTGQ